ncbi:MAG: sigma-54-dependent Fis family transcriptional regulator [bacterium]|nr:sigma-54-dependent Fis family transcriptional regulator [bacterium]
MILIVDDDFSVTASIGLLLKQEGYEVMGVAGPEEALGILAKREIALVLQDMNFSRNTSGEEGLELLARIKEQHPALPVILITAWGSIDLAVAGIKAGAVDFITKPWHDDQVLSVVKTALGLAVVDDAAEQTGRDELDERFSFKGVIGQDPSFLRILRMVGRVARTDAPVLITGASGTGKEVVAELLHRNSSRSRDPFVCVNLGGISTQLFDSEMFGHVKGAFTDARQDRQGRFAKAEGGTIFLDEIGDLDLSCQVKLLRVLQERTYEALGSSRSLTLNARVISATNRELEEAVGEGLFREDLLYRLNLIVLRLPTLAERRSDIGPLAEHFLEEAGHVYNRPNVHLAPSGLKWLEGREWPGNIRQLRHLLVRSLLVIDSDLLGAGDFEQAMLLNAEERAGDPLPAVGSMTIAEIERSMILKCLTYYNGNISRVAEALGLSRPALYRRLDKYGINS